MLCLLQITQNGILKHAEIALPLKYCLSNFWRALEIPLGNWKIELKLKWTKYCVLPGNGNDNGNDNANNVIFTINGTKLYVPVVTLSARENQKLLKLLSKGFKKQKCFQKLNQVIVIMGENMTVIREPKTCYFDSDRSRNTDENLKCETEFIIQSSESLAENKLKNEIQQNMRYKNIIKKILDKNINVINDIQ